MTTNKIWLKNASYLLMSLCIIMIIPLHLFPCFISGFLIYEIISLLTPYFEKFINTNYAKWIIVILITCIITIIIILGIIKIVNFIIEDSQKEISLIMEINRIFSDISNHIPKYITSFLPKNHEELKKQIISLIESNFILIRNTSHSLLHGIITLIIGLIIGIVIALSKPLPNKTYFTQQLLNRIYYLSRAFHNIVFAQIKISMLNTLLTGTIILVIFPILGQHLPLSKTLIMFTFLIGLLPIIGNIISNILIVISALSISLTIAIIMIIYLILIHKLEYFLNAEIMGNRIKAQPWELMLAMLTLEATFGLEGVIAAPIFYAYLKNELRAINII